MLGGHDTISGKLTDIDTGMGLNAWTVYLDANNNGQFDPGLEGSTITTAAGSYSFLVSPGSNYRVRVALPDGSLYGQLTDNPLSVSFAPGSDLTVDGVDFLFSSTADGFYVASMYTHVLGRTPDLAGASSWVQKLQNGADRLQVAAGFWESAEHRGIQVDSYYANYLNRTPDPAGRTGWIQGFLNGASETLVQTGFLTSAEYTQTHESNSAFVEGLYQDVLDRPEDAGGAALWITALNNNEVTRAFAATNFLTSAEEDRRIVDSFYEGFLGREPDPAGQELWVDALQTGTMTQDQIAEQFLASDEFFADAAADKGMNA
jgi:hypothetical protein